ncbi:hypothetical protein DASC09_058590 [Saccharomycopsis crataegensis]|uniref:Major facilitator superfamily (MFS) profile domain-containing protein n=1 Tax=Saccharomycopsis crataegensis TaxID=43959 RepID=A0AAV5QV95_9ASCO|nr:hypothetical protein DASC09_058590 [Saccharomycopsis crataegensis]
MSAVTNNPDGSSLSNKEEYVVSVSSHKQKEASSSGFARWFQWFEPGTSPKEKKLILKLQFFILSYSMLAYFLKYLDQTNISNAYVSGMKEDLNLNGNQLSWFNTFFNIGTIVGSIPAVFLANYFRPRYFLPIMDLLWALTVLFVYKCSTANQIYVCRFFLGLFESATNPFGHVMLGSWFKSNEVLRLGNLYIIAGIIGQATSSYIQSGLQSSMEGRLGLHAYQWMFIFEACLSVPIIIYGLFVIPDYPYNTQAFYLNEWERKRAKERLEEDGRVTKKISYNLDTLKEITFSWQPYVFSIGYCLWTLTAASYMLQFFEVYLKSLKKYSISYINNFPTIISGVNLVTMLSSGYIADKMNRRWPVLMVVGCLLTVSMAILLKSHDEGVRKFGYCLTGVYGCYTPMLAGWCNISCKKSLVLRSFTIPAMIVIGTIVVTPYQQHVFPSSDAPYYEKTQGMRYAIAFTVCLLLWTSIAIPLCDYYWGNKDDAKVKKDPEYQL